VGVARLLFDDRAAMRGLKEWCDYVLRAHYEATSIRRGRRNAPASSQRQVTVTPLTTVPMKEGWTPNVVKTPQANRMLAVVTAAAVGPYTLQVLGEDATYTALPGDDEEAIRDGLRLAVDALGLPVSTDDSGEDGLEVLGDVAGQWIGVRVVAGSLSVATIDDVLRIAKSDPSKWTIRITVDDIRPAQGTSSATEATQLLLQYLAGATVPVIPGDATVYTDDYLSSVGLLYEDHTVLPTADYATGGTGRRGAQPTVFHARSPIDVVFRVTTGMAFDQPTIESFGAPSVTIAP